MLMLAAQVAVQPRISRWLVRPEDSKVYVALMEEVAKTVLAIVLWWLQGSSDVRGNRGGLLAVAANNWSLPSSLASAGFPAVLYAVQAVLTYVGLQHLDAVTFNGLSQLKTVSAAIFCYLILGTPQSLPQVVAIALLLASSLLFQLPGRKLGRASQGPAAIVTGCATVTATEDVTGRAQTGASAAAAATAVSFRGLTACLAATAISGLAGALSQRGVQMTRGSHGGNAGGSRDPYLYCAEVSIYSALFLIVSSLLKRLLARTYLRRSPAQAAYRDETVTRSSRAPAASESRRASCTSTFRWSLWIPVTVKAVGGIVTVLVHKHAGSVPKGFALVLGLVLSGMLERDPLTLPQLFGTILVLTSSWLHFTNSPR
jgi:UDP-sugar transporter A1/2/3